MKVSLFIFIFLFIACGRQLQNNSTSTESLVEVSGLRVCGDLSYKDKGFFLEDDEGEYFIIGDNQDVRDQMNEITEEERPVCIYSNTFGSHDGINAKSSGQTIYAERLEFL